MKANEKNILTEDWYAQINHVVQKTTFEELKKWINDGKLQPNHKVKVTNLSWIEANKVPAFQKLFEARRTKKQKQPPPPITASLPASATIPLGKPRTKSPNVPKLSEKTVLTPNLAKETVLTPVVAPFEPKKDTPSESKTETAESSIPFQIYEKKLAEANQAEEIKKLAEESEKSAENTEKTVEEAEKLAEEVKKPVEETEKPVEEIEKSVEETEKLAEETEKQPEQKEKTTKRRAKKNGKSQLASKPKKRMLFVKSILSFLAGCGCMFILAWGAAYVWVFQLGGTAKADEKSISELVFLEEKFSTDKIGLRLKVAASEQLADKQENQPQKLDLAQETAKLEKQYEMERKIIIENHQAKLLNNEFNNIFYFGSGGLIILFLLIRGFYNQKYQTSSNQSIEADIHAAAQAENHLTMPPDSHTTNPSDVNSSNSVTEGASQTESGTPKTAESSPSVYCFSHQDKTAKCFCTNCSKYFCDECLQVINTVENNCPVCQVVCRPIELLNSMGDALPENGMNQDEKTQNIGVFTALMISLLLSASMSYFWVYGIAQNFLKKETEVVQNDSQKSGINAAANQNSTANTGMDKASSESNKSCVDTQTRQPIKCDEESGKNKSIEKQAAEKASSTEELTAEAGKGSDRRLFIQIFIGLFILLFGGLQFGRFFGKKVNKPTNA